MAIISQETFDKFTEEEKRKLRQQYSHLLKVSENEEDWNVRMCANSEKQSLINVFGKENLILQPEIKTWEDVVASNIHYVFDNYVLVRTCVDCNKKLLQKLEATLKISKLIELGYGGMVRKEEWKDNDLFKWYIVIGMEGKLVIDSSYENWQEFIAFHTKEQAEKFMSYPENKALVEQYYMI